MRNPSTTDRMASKRRQSDSSSGDSSRGALDTIIGKGIEVDVASAVLMRSDVARRAFCGDGSAWGEWSEIVDVGDVREKVGDRISELRRCRLRWQDHFE